MLEIPAVDDEADIGEARPDRVQDTVAVATEKDLADILGTLCAGDVPHQGDLVQPAMPLHLAEASRHHGVPPVGTDEEATAESGLLARVSPPNAHDSPILPQQIAHPESGCELSSILDGEIQENGIQPVAPDRQAVDGRIPAPPAPRIGCSQGSPGGRVDHHADQRARPCLPD